MKYRHTTYRLKIWGVILAFAVVFVFCIQPADAGENGEPAPMQSHEITIT